MFRSASLFIATYFTVAVFTIFATSNVDSIVGILHKIYIMQRILIHIKSRISLLKVPLCTQGMQRTWWPEAGNVIVTGPYCLAYPAYARSHQRFQFTPRRTRTVSDLKATEGLIGIHTSDGLTEYTMYIQYIQYTMQMNKKIPLLEGNRLQSIIKSKVNVN